MKFKNLLSIAFCGAVAISASAQSHHGYYMTPKLEHTEAYLTGETATPLTLNCWATPELIMPMEQPNGSVLASNIYENNSADMIARETTLNGTSKNYFLKLNGTSLSPSVTADNFKNGYLEVTFPDKKDYPRAEANTPQWASMPAANNVMLFHILLGSSPSRIGDSGNELSATGDECQISDLTAVYVGIKAPAGCTVKTYICTSSLSKSNYQKDTSGLTWNENFYGTVSPAAFDFEDVCDGTYKEMTSGPAYNCLAAMKYSSASWPNGYCGKYIDVAVYGVKPGDVIGFGGVQTLHDGWTPKSFVDNAGVNDIIADETNAPVEYYNLQGVKVAADNLSNGIYIKRQGSKATKVVVK